MKMPTLPLRGLAVVLAALALAGCSRNDATDRNSTGGVPTTAGGTPGPMASAPAVPASEAVTPAASAAPQNSLPQMGTAAAGNPADQSVQPASAPGPAASK